MDHEPHHSESWLVGMEYTGLKIGKSLGLGLGVGHESKLCYKSTVSHWSGCSSHPLAHLSTERVKAEEISGSSLLPKARSQSNSSLCHFQLQEYQRHSHLGLRIPKFQASNLVLQGVRCSARTVSRLCDAAVASPLVTDLLSKVFHHTQLCRVKRIHILKPPVKHLSNQHPENILIFTHTILYERAYFRAL